MNAVTSHQASNREQGSIRPLAARPEPDGPHFSFGYLFAAGLIVLLFIALRLWRLSSSCLWFDEIFSVHAAHHTWQRLFSFIGADVVHPPLFYVLLKCWILVGGNSLLWLRLFPALTAIATLVPLVFVSRQLRLNALEFNLALFLMACNGYLIRYAREVRMYSLLMLLGLVSLWAFVEAVNDPRSPARNMIILAAVNLALVYAHYFGWLVIASETLIVLDYFRSRLRDFAIAGAIVLVGFSPWILVVSRAAAARAGALKQNIGWMPRPRGSDLVQYFTLLTEPFLFSQSSDESGYSIFEVALGLVTAGLPITLLAWRIIRKDRDIGRQRGREIAILAAFFAIPTALAFLMSRVLPYSIWGTRHLIFGAAPFLICGGIALVRLRPAWLRSAVLLLAGCWFLLAGFVAVVTPETRYIWCAWGELVPQMARLEPPAGSPVPVYAFEDLVAYHLWYALDSAGETRFKVTVVRSVPGIRDDPAYFLPRDFDDVGTANLSAIRGNDIWVALRDVGWDESREPVRSLRIQGYQVERILESAAQGEHAYLARFTREKADPR